MVWEFVPPGQHIINITQRAIQTATYHFVAILVGVSITFPMHLCCRLIPQAEITLNLLRQSRTTPNVSANAHVHGTHNFMKSDHWHRWYVMCKRTRNRIREEHGTHTHAADGMLAHQWTITDASKCGLKRKGQKGIQT